MLRSVPLLLSLLLLTSCGDADERPAVPADTTGGIVDRTPLESPVPAAPPPRDTIVVQADGAFPGRPQAPVRIEGACPFECCTYGRWTMSGPTRIYTRPDPSAPVAHEVGAGTVLDVETGHVVLTSLARWVLRSPTQGYVDYQTHRTIPAGDTVVVLDYVGEGIFRTWHEGTVYQMDDLSPRRGRGANPPAAEQLGETARQWWARVTTPGREGWLWMDETPSVRGADACG